VEVKRQVVCAAAFAISAATLGVSPVCGAILYQFTTTDSNVPANDDGYDPAAVSILKDSAVNGPADGTSLGAGNVGLSRFFNTEFAGFSLASGNGNTIDNATEFATGYFQYTITANPGSKLNLMSLDFGSAVGGTGTRGFEIYAAVNGGPINFGDTPVLDVDAETGARATPVARSASLTAAKFQGIDSVTFRYYPTVPGTGNTIDFTGMTLNGTVTPVPEPSSAVALLGVTAAAMGLRRRHRRPVR